MQYGDPDGHGHYGILDVTADGLLCHECGWRGAHLGLHSWQAHGITASAYRERHGLRRSKGLVAADLHQKMSAGSAERLPAALVQARDPQRATSIRLAKKRPVSAEAAADRDRLMAELARAPAKAPWSSATSAKPRSVHSEPPPADASAHDPAPPNTTV
ncbi:MAG: MucR family transcriptional regulator, partial [Demequina sp.]|nr:MucR family transcriptional regulator [Demequina sp.]